MNKQLPVSSRPDFTPLPSDPKARLTPEQSAALWRGDVDGFLKRMVKDQFVERLAAQHIHSATPDAGVPLGAANG